MLIELEVRDLALLEECTLEFGAGLNAITGETGAGKSLLVGALELLLGRRPRPGLLRTGAQRAVVEGRFRLGSGGQRGDRTAAVSAWLARHLPQVLEEWSELDSESPRELILTRTLQRVEGDRLRTRAQVNHHPVSGRDLRGVASLLIEICGQHDHQRLLDPDEQLRLVDGFGGLGRQVAAYRRIRGRWVDLVDRVLELREQKAQRRDRLELLRHELSELRELEPERGEFERLVGERNLLRHGAELRTELGGLVGTLGEEEGALLDRLREVGRRVEGWVPEVHDLEAPASDLQSAAIHVEEALSSLRSFVDGLELDPRRLEEVEDRLAGYEAQERRHGVRADELSELAGDLEEELERLDQEETGLAGLEAEIRAARTVLVGAAEELSVARDALREPLREAVQTRLGHLGLEKAELQLRVRPRMPFVDLVSEEEDESCATERLADDRKRFGERGKDHLELWLAANPGEAPRPLREAASGGEAARILLALQVVLAASDRGRTIVFDEIDSGVGGRLGPAVSAELDELGGHHQVVCVTHLPSIAAGAGRHQSVRKEVRNSRTYVHIHTLEGDARIEEVADMIAGGSAHESARAEARRLLGAGSS